MRSTRVLLLLIFALLWAGAAAAQEESSEASDETSKEEGGAADAETAAREDPTPEVSQGDLESPADSAPVEEEHDLVPEGTGIVVYGGEKPDDSVAGQARKQAEQTVDGEDDPSDWMARWFLADVQPLTENFYLLGAAAVEPCRGEAVALADWKAKVEEGRRAWDEFESEAAIAAYRESKAMMACLSDVAPPDLLIRQFFELGIALYYEDENDPKLAAESFRDVHRTRPDLPWNEDYHYKPSKLYYESRDALNRVGTVTVWNMAPAVQLHANGNIIESSLQGQTLLPGKQLLQVTTNSGVHTQWVDLRPGAKVLFGDPEVLWAQVSSTDPESGLEVAFAARKALGKALGRNYWLAQEKKAVGVLADSGSFARGAGIISAYKPRPFLELGLGYQYQDKHSSYSYTDSPSASWIAPQLGVGIRLAPPVDVHLSGGLALGGKGSDEQGEFRELLPYFRLGAGIELPKGPVRPGLRIDGLIQIVGNEYTDRNNDGKDDGANDSLGGALAAFTLAFGGGQTPIWGQFEAGGGYLGGAGLGKGSPIAMVNLRMQVRGKGGRR